jgi:hypothetical protein
VPGTDYCSIDEARREYQVGRNLLFRFLKEGKLTRYKREGDRRTLLSRQELDRLFTPRPVDRHSIRQRNS